MGAGASIQLDPTWSDTDLNRISATLASVCEPEVLRKVAKSLLEEESKGRAEMQDVKGLLYELPIPSKKLKSIKLCYDKLVLQR